jgi:hypothetical protein
MSSAGLMAATRRDSSRATAVCALGTPQPSPLEARTMPLNEGPSARSSKPRRLLSCATRNCLRFSGSRAKLAIAVLLLRPQAWSWRSRDVPVRYSFLPFQREDRTIKPWDQTPTSGHVPSGYRKWGPARAWAPGVRQSLSTGSTSSEVTPSRAQSGCTKSATNE